MPKLPDTVLQCRSSCFEKVLKRELENLPSGTLPLEKATSRGGFVDDSDISASVINVKQDENEARALVGIFFTEIIVGCSCGDDPMPENAYCEILISIDKATSEAEFEVVQQ